MISFSSLNWRVLVVETCDLTPPKCTGYDDLAAGIKL